ncbi:FAD-dependent oxidoreductase [Aspergillus stella-maris]|uniref:FAD-dependent oxidoreductase n=1 Tax=Aspergillus stella-maris TaxID=1810926 RepID=UPI003CCC9E51
MIKTIAIIGGGWSGCHTALELTAAGYQVTLIEKGPELFNAVSGQFGIRIHKGPHYPRSYGTRESCRRTFNRFCAKYPEVVVPVRPAIYALAQKDSTGHESKVTADEFSKVCRESKECVPIDIAQYFGPESELEVAYTLDEPCALLNPYLKGYFEEKLSRSGIKVRCNEEVCEVWRLDGGYCVSTTAGHEDKFDRVINSTGYASALPDGLLSNLPIKAQIKYQACTALSYTDTWTDHPPMSFIVMDGWFPCLMPCVGQPGKSSDYVVTHGAYTILGSFETPDEAGLCLSNMSPTFMEDQIRPMIEEQMERFWPKFTERFEYKGWKGSVLPKLVTDTEFRSSVVFEAEGVIYIFPGKISNVVDVADEVFALINKRDVIRSNGYGYARESELSRSRKEIEKLPTAKHRNTCSLQTHQQLSIKA